MVFFAHQVNYIPANGVRALDSPDPSNEAGAPVLRAIT